MKKKKTCFTWNRQQSAITVTWKKRLAMVGLEGAAKLVGLENSGRGEIRGKKTREKRACMRNEREWERKNRGEGSMRAMISRCVRLTGPK